MAGLLLLGLPAIAQPDLTDPRSAKVVFTQNFEQDWDAWKSTVIDTLKEIQYYSKEGNTNGTSFTPWSDASWKKGPVRVDTVMYIYKGEMTVIDSGEKKKGAELWGDDNETSATIINDNSDERHAELSAFGEADGGGAHYFQFTSDTFTNVAGGYTTAYSNQLAARYRRNLFVRLNPGDVTENSSYRLTFYAKAKTLPAHVNMVATPTVYADVMRGYYHCEKPFSMGYISNDATSHPYEYSNTFEYTKNDFGDDGNWDNWEKITFMTYYTTDSIAEFFVFKDGYWWAETDWTWKKGSLDKEGNAIATDLNYIVQPDKYFVRLGFPADYTVYAVDNISLTKSWIGGCEYYGDKMRVDFGYKTNLKDLVAAEKKAHGFDQIELDKSTFDVWCKKTGQDWFQMPMRSAEYHADGYMYLFTGFFDLGDETYSYQFADYDSVYVTFRNPSDPTIQLLYTDAPFPKGNDSLWIKGDTATKTAGKIVPDFVNELAIPNPTAKIWKGVYSKYDLPPVMLQAPFEEGSFAITPTNQLKFKFSRKIDIDNKDNTDKAIAYVGGERWKLSWSASDSMLVLDRDVDKIFAENAGKNMSAALAGDYEIQILKLHGIGTDPGADVIRHYHFGAFNRDVAAATVKVSDWRSEIKETGAWDRPMPASLWCYEAEDGFYGGEGLNYSPYKKCGLYKMKDDGKNGNALFYLSGRTNGIYGSLYTVETLAAAAYNIEFSSFGWSRQNDIKVYVYKKPAEMTYDNLKGATKTLVGTYKPGYQTSWSGNDTEESWNASVERFSFTFSIAEAGDYVIEWETPKEGSQSYYGVAIGNYTLAAGASAAAAYGLNKAVALAEARAALATANTAIYSGEALTALQAAIREYKTGGAFDIAHAENQAPSVWAEAIKAVQKVTSTLATRMDKIDALQTKIADAEKKVAGLTEDYKKFDVTAKLEVLIDSAKNKFPITTEADKNVDNLTTLLDNAIKAVDSRVDKNNNLNTLIADAKKEINAKEREDYAEYGALVDTLAKAEAFNAITALDAEVDAMSANLKTATLLYAGKVSGWKGQTERLKAYRALAEELEIEEITGNWAIKNFIDTTNVDNDEIADIYKAAIKYQLYQLIAADELDDEVDVTPFIKNYNLYVTPKIVERTDIKANAGGARVADTLGAQIQHVQHQWNSGSLNGQMPIWIMIQTVWYDDLYPGWSAWAGTDGNAMVTPDNSSYSRLENHLACFDGQIGMDWNGKAEIKEVLTGLPAGYYSLGVGFYQQTGSNTQLKAMTWKTLAGGKDTLITMESAKAGSGAKSLALDSIAFNTGKDSLTIDLIVTSGNGWTEADNFTLTFMGKDESFNYDGAVAAAKADFENKLKNRVTIVNAPKAQAGRVEFYNAGGMKVDAPKSGLYIKVENGVATKVFVK